MNLNKYRVKKSFGSIETNEVFLDTLAHNKEEEFGLSEKKFEVAISTRVIVAIFGLFFLLAAILFGKTFYLQVFQGATLRAVAENNRGSISLVHAQRGIIYDKNMKKLVVNSPAYDLVCDKRNYSLDSADFTKKINTIANILYESPFALWDQIKASENSKVVLAENLSQENILVLETRLNDLPGCQIEKNTARSYVMGPVFSHVLGYTARAGSGYTGKVGLESYYEQELRGVPGQTEVIKTALGVQKSNTIISQPETGDNLVLNIDADLQKVVYDALEKSIKNVGSKKGVAIALNPRNGAVLALVSYPSYDNNIFSQTLAQSDYDELINDPHQPFFNRAIAAKYPTGSTIKPFTAAGALQEKLIDPNKLINDPGYILVKNQYDPSIVYTFSGVKPHGLVDMRKALAVSSNVYFFTIGGGYGDQKGLGPAGIKKYLGMYGWEQKTGIDLPGEFKGFVPSPSWKKKVKNENWWDGDTYNLSIGQSDLQTTPLQVAVAYAAIVNGGTLYKPQIVNKIIDSSGDVPVLVQQFVPEVTGKVLVDEANLRVIREGMRDAVSKPYGSSVSLNDLPVQVAGKTGTVETGKAGVFNTWSASFAPYDNPEIVFVTTIEGVQGLRPATLPVAYDVLQYYFNQ